MLRSKPGNKSIRAALAALAFLTAGLGTAACTKPATSQTGQVETIRFGDLHVESSAFIYIAEEQKLFAQNGLNVVVNTYDTGPAAIEALLNNQVDLITSGEFAFIVRILNKDNLSIIACMDKYQAFYLIGRQDRGISTPADLKGKVIGVVRQALTEFYLGRFLDLHGLGIESVQVVDVRPADWLEAISSGEVDAIVVSQLYLKPIQTALGEAAIVWPAQSYQDAFGLVYGQTEWLNQNSKLAQRFLLSLAEAEDYSVRHPVEARAIVQKRLNLDNDYLASAWPQHRFSLALDESLIAAMNDEARWLIGNKLTSERQLPNFADYINEKNLLAVKAQAVDIIR
jgi:NitT/TauT family transport system substrate-binding protein